MRFFLKILLRGFFKFRVHGSENLPQEGPIVLVSNHVSYMDPIVVGVAVSRPLRYMAKEELFGGFSGRVLKALGAFPVKRAGMDKMAIRKALKLLSEGDALLVFPEGTRGNGVKLGQVKDGVGMIICKSNVPAIPVVISGTEKALPRGSRWPKRCLIEVRFGSLIHAGCKSDICRKREKYNVVTKEIMSVMEKMVEESSRTAIMGVH